MVLFKNNRLITVLYGVTLLVLGACGGVQFLPHGDLYVSQEERVKKDPISTSDAGYRQEGNREGWQLAWSDEFDGNEVDQFKWKYLIDGGGGGNNELQYYTDSKANSFVQNGMLHIKAIKRPAPIKGRDYTSARLHSTGKAHWKNGRFDIRAKLPVQQGIWPAIWMLPKDEVYGSWPQSGEIDIVESIGNKPKTVHGSAHFGATPPNNKHITHTTEVKRGNLSNAFHLYSVEWDESEIRWYLDDKLYGTTQKSDLTISKWPFDQEFYLILNLAVGGDWPGSPNEETIFPKYMFVDYVRVYEPTPKS